MVRVLGLVLLSAIAHGAELLPWQTWLDEPVAGQSKALDLVGQPWSTNGDYKLQRPVEPGPWGGPGLQWDVAINHHHPGQYPMGWPSFELLPKPGLDWQGYQALQFWIRGETDSTKALSLRFILWTAGKGRMNVELPGLKKGEWVLATEKLRDIPELDKVERIHFFLSDSDYHHGDKLSFRVGGFRLVNLAQVKSTLPENEAAVGLWVGDRADQGDQAVLLAPGAKELPALLVVETGAKLALRADDELAVRLRNVFTGQDVQRTQPLGAAYGPGKVDRVQTRLDVAGLAPAYYLVTADLRRAGKSLLAGRVGCDDLYVKAPGETATYTALSLRLGMLEWARDQRHGDIMCRTKIALPHTYDPFDPATYAQFIRLFAISSGGQNEGNEAGDTGLAYACAALRATGDTVRLAYAEKLLDESLDHLITRRQAPNGSTISWCNELSDEGIGVGGNSQAFGSCNSDQHGEWMRAITYGLLYDLSAGRAEQARKLSRAVRKAGDYLVAHCRQDSDGVPGVIRHLILNEQPDGSVKPMVYHQEGRQCDVYLGRILAGLSYYAYAMQLMGEEVPAEWFAAMDHTVAWSAKKMKPDGWFDWQCEDVVEGGCHTFLGNIYIGEGLFGCYLADKLAGRDEQAKAAAEAAKKAYHYVTDSCIIQGRKFSYPLEFWVGPYVYWLFTQYKDTVGTDATFEDWRTTLDRQWSVTRGWHDFLDRARTGGCGRTETNGMLETAILGYLGIKQMAELGKPWQWPVNLP